MNTALYLCAQGSPARASHRASRTVTRAGHDFYPAPPEAGRYSAEHRYCRVVSDYNRSSPPRFWWLRMAGFRRIGGRV
jgi:hypothetical protein